MPPKQRISKIKEFFPTVSAKIHAINTTMQFAVEEERVEERRLKQLREHAVKSKRLSDEILDLQKQSEAAKGELDALRRDSATEVLDEQQQEILEILENIDNIADIEQRTMAAKKRKKAWNKRPECWLDIAKHFEKYGLANTIDAYRQELQELPSTSHEQNFRRWRKDMLADKVPGYVHRQPIIGEVIDNELYTEVMDRILLGLTIDATILREILLTLLTQHERMDLVMSNSSFGQSWAQRFFKRHKLQSRVVTTKMREQVPADFDAKEADYLRVGAMYIAKYNIPSELVYGIDETNALFVTRATRQRAKKGAKRVRAIGVGKEKAQITVTLGAVEGTGKILKTQYIFQGKTNRCHPKDAPAEDEGYFTHTISHWQSEASFLEYLDQVIMPEKEETIQRLGLPADQKCILKLDVHFSHKTQAVMDRMKLMNVLPLFVPAGCTDIIQECDTVINKPFKNAMKKEFRDYLHHSFMDFRTKNPQRRPCEWAPKLKMSDLKPLMVRFVKAGVAALQTPAMAQAIKTAFHKDGRFEIMRSPEMQLKMNEQIALDLLNGLNIDVFVVPHEVEQEQDDEDAAVPLLAEDEDDSDNNDSD